MKPLSYRQRCVLEEVKRAMPAGLRRGCTNPTLVALEKRGLVRLEFIPSQFDPRVRVERWYSTEREVLP